MRKSQRRRALGGEESATRPPLESNPDGEVRSQALDEVHVMINCTVDDVVGANAAGQSRGKKKKRRALVVPTALCEWNRAPHTARTYDDVDRLASSSEAARCKRRSRNEA